MPKLASHRYGKARVRVAKILRDKEHQSIVEIDVAAMLEGDFESSYTAGDNTKVVPTDTIKNTINILAKEKLGPRGLPGEPDNRKMTPQNEKNTPKSGEFDGHVA